MNCKVEKTQNANEVKLEITIEAEKFENAMKKVYFQNAKYFNIPGFRKGKAPMNIVEKYYGAQIFYEDAFNEVFTTEYFSTIFIGALPFLNPGILKYFAFLTNIFFIAASNTLASIVNSNLTSFLFSIFSTLTLINNHPPYN